MPPSRCRGIVIAGSDGAATAADLALRTGCAIVREPAREREPEALYLHVSGDGLALGPLAARTPRCAPRWRARPQAARRDPLLRAVGRGTRHLLDACAGFGEDAFALACAGIAVTACERDPVVFELLAQAQRGALADPALADAARRIQLYPGDAREWLAAPQTEAPDTILLDPMFPPKRKRSALPRLEMQVLRALTGGEDPDDREARMLWALAREHARQRVVWKRPPHAPVHGAPSARFRSKLVRYDVYHRPPPAN